MKICLLSYRGNEYCGGQGVYIHYLSYELQRLGHEVEIIGGPPYPVPPDGVKLHKLPSNSYYQSPDCISGNTSALQNPISFYEFATSNLGMFPEPFAFTIRAYHKLRKSQNNHNKFNIIHDNQSLGYGLLLMKKLEVPVVATIHHPIPIDRDLDIAYAKNLREKFILRRWYSFCTMQQIVSKRMDRIITVSQRSAKDIEQSFGISNSKIRVTYNGIDTKLFKSRNNLDKEPNSIILVNNTISFYTMI